MTCAAAADCELFVVIEAGPARTGHFWFARQREASEKGTMVGDFAGRVNVPPGPDNLDPSTPFLYFFTSTMILQSFFTMTALKGGRSLLRRSHQRDQAGRAV